jgi:hypothetical protein
MASVSLARWCNNRQGQQANRDIPAIHHQVDLLNSYQMDLEHNNHD